MVYTHIRIWQQEPLAMGLNLLTRISDKWRICGSQTNWKITQILLFYDDLLMFYQTFGVSLSLSQCGRFVAGGVSTSTRYCASIRT